ncbi:MAG: hypothetical protein JXQ96_03270 [Cyclobacteriaceae bacterium]
MTQISNEDFKRLMIKYTIVALVIQVFPELYYELGIPHPIDIGIVYPYLFNLAAAYFIYRDLEKLGLPKQWLLLALTAVSPMIGMPFFLILIMNEKNEAFSGSKK